MTTPAPQKKAVRLGDIAHARSGDKGASSNIGVIATSQAAYDLLRRELTPERVKDHFAPFGVTKVVRYDLPNLLAFNFLLSDVLDGGGSVSLRIDAQGKAFGQILLEMRIEAGVLD
jgi:hypothetical protein